MHALPHNTRYYRCGFISIMKQIESLRVERITHITITTTTKIRPILFFCSQNNRYESNTPLMIYQKCPEKNYTAFNYSVFLSLADTNEPNCIGINSICWEQHIVIRLCMHRYALGISTGIYRWMKMPYFSLCIKVKLTIDKKKILYKSNNNKIDR